MKNKSVVILGILVGFFFNLFAEVIEYKKGVDLSQITARKETSILLFGAEWCRPCGIMNANVATVLEDSLFQANTVVLIDVDNYTDIYTQYKITNIPAMLVYKAGEQVESVVGLQTDASIKNFINKHSN